MKTRLVFLAAACCSFATAAWAQDHVTQPSPPAVAQIPPAPTPPVSRLFEYVPGNMDCAGVTVTARQAERIFPTIGFADAGATAAPISFTFRIDAEGRPLDIEREVGKFAPGTYAYVQGDDVAPAFATWRFAPGDPRAKCRITFEALGKPATEAPLSLLRRYIVAPHNRSPQERQLFRRIQPADSDCFGANSPEVRLRAFPAFEEIPQARGTWSYAMAGFDIDASGKPVNVRIVDSDGNTALDRATIDAVQRSRFAPAAKHGCTYPYYRRSKEPLEAPKAPDAAAFAPADAKCPADQTAWTSMPPLRFPQGFQQRSIEGWAVIGYDVAPWGATGNVRVLAAEPAAMFGEEARSIVSMARQAPSQAGRSGCVDIVRFVMPDKDHPEPTDGF